MLSRQYIDSFEGPKYVLRPYCYIWLMKHPQKIFREHPHTFSTQEIANVIDFATIH